MRTSQQGKLYKVQSKRISGSWGSRSPQGALLLSGANVHPAIDRRKADLDRWRPHTNLWILARAVSPDNCVLKISPILSPSALAAVKEDWAREPSWFFRAEVPRVVLHLSIPRGEWRSRKALARMLRTFSGWHVSSVFHRWRSLGGFHHRQSCSLGDRSLPAVPTMCS